MAWPMQMYDMVDFTDRQIRAVYGNLDALQSNPRLNDKLYQDYLDSRNERYARENSAYRFKMRVYKVSLFCLTIFLFYTLIHG